MNAGQKNKLLEIPPVVFFSIFFYFFKCQPQKINGGYGWLLAGNYYDGDKISR